MTDRVGQKIGNYRLVRLLGRGGFAEVYLAEHTYLDSFAAIKLLYVRVAQEDIAAQFQQEGQMLAKLLHPHIVRVLDFDIEDSTPYLVMDYAPGGTLRTRHPKGSRVPLPTIVEYVKQVAQALQHAHDRLFIHRDLKPENLLISREGTILLSDFGLAVISRASGTSLNSLAGTSGTPCYMAPELFGSRPRKASDQYSLGVVVYEWLCGAPPFPEGNAYQLGYQHIHKPVPPLRQQVPALSPAVELVVMTALAKQPEDRFGSVRAFATALEWASLETPVQLSRLATSAPLPQPPLDDLLVEQSTSAPPIHSTHSQSEPLTPPVRSGPSSAPVTPPNQSLPSSSPMMPLPQPVGPSASTPASAESTPSLSPELKSKPAERTLSRRTVLLGAAGIATVGTIGTAVWWVTRPAQQGTLFVTYRGHSNGVTSVAWSPDGTRLASSSDDHSVQVWNAHDGSQPFTYRGHSDYVTSVAWSPDSTRVASGSTDHSVQVWNAHDGSQPFTYHGHSDIVESVTWSPDGTRLASGSDDQTMQVWNVHDGSQPFTYHGHSDIVESVAWSPDGTHIASGSINYVQVWNAHDGSQPFTYHGHSDVVWSVAWSPDGTRLASGSGDNIVQVWDAHDGSQLFTYRGHSSAVKSVTWSPDGTRIASGSSDKTVQVWQAV